MYCFETCSVPVFSYKYDVDVRQEKERKKETPHSLGIAFMARVFSGTYFVHFPAVL